MYILIIEDNRDLQEALLWYLENKGYSVHCASDGLEAIEKLQSDPLPYVILVDLMMPVMSGYEFRSYLADNERLSKIPTIILSGRADTDIELREHEFFYCKTLSLKNIVAKIQEIVEGRRLGRMEFHDEVLFKNILDNSTDMYQVFFAVRNEQQKIVDFTCIYINKTAQRIYGKYGRQKPAAAKKWGRNSRTV